MNGCRRIALGLALTWAGLAPSASGGPLKEALKEGKVSLDTRYRLETVSQDNALRDATANTVRARLGSESAPVKGFKGVLEFEHTAALGNEDFNSTANDRSGYSVVPDPAITELNQAYLHYTGPQDGVVRYGRQRIVLDNARFVGNVGWRQNEQTFDGYALKGPFAQTQMIYAYLTNANRVIGTNRDMDTHLLNIRYQEDNGRLSSYAYLQGFNDTPGLSTKTFGARLTSSGRFPLVLEYANQSDYADNPASYALAYWLAEIGIQRDATALHLGYEVLEGDGSNAVQTPLANLHSLNGWADQFLTTPADGLEDLYVKLTGGEQIRFQAVYHAFSANDGGADYGDEIDLLLSRQFGDYSLLLKYARYSAGNGSRVDTDKLWVSVQMQL